MFIAKVFLHVFGAEGAAPASGKCNAGINMVGEALPSLHFMGTCTVNPSSPQKVQNEYVVHRKMMKHN